MTSNGPPSAQRERNRCACSATALAVSAAMAAAEEDETERVEGMTVGRVATAPIMEGSMASSKRAKDGCDKEEECEKTFEFEEEEVDAGVASAAVAAS